MDVNCEKTMTLCSPVSFSRMARSWRILVEGTRSEAL